MVHSILRFLLKICFWVYYKRIDYQGIGRVPETGGVILACNHPNSFLDALLVGAFLKRRLHFLVRSDVFNTPFKAWVLGKLSLLPMYRLQEGTENLEKNRETFARCHELLDKGDMILIFVEGICVQELRLRPLKKGAARIAFEYVKAGKKLAVVPVGLNYLKPLHPREEVMIRVEEPIALETFADDYAANSGRTITEFNKILDASLRRAVIHLADRKNDPALTQVLEIHRNDGAPLTSLVDFAKQAHVISSTDPTRYHQLIEKADTYAKLLSETNLTDNAIREPRRGSLLTPLLAPFYLVGFFLNGLPWLTATKLAKAKVRKSEFYDSVLIGAFMFLNVFHLLFIFLILLLFHPLWAFVVPGVLLVTAFISTMLHDPLRHNRLLIIRDRLPKEKLAAMQSLRREIVELSTFNP